MHITQLTVPIILIQLPYFSWANNIVLLISLGLFSTQKVSFFFIEHSSALETHCIISHLSSHQRIIRHIFSSLCARTSLNFTLPFRRHYTVTLWLNPARVEKTKAKNGENCSFKIQKVTGTKSTTRKPPCAKNSGSLSFLSRRSFLIVAWFVSAVAGSCRDQAQRGNLVGYLHCPHKVQLHNVGYLTLTCFLLTVMACTPVKQNKKQQLRAKLKRTR